MRHPDQQAIFVEDFIDRRPAQVRSVEIVPPDGGCQRPDALPLTPA